MCRKEIFNKQKKAEKTSQKFENANIYLMNDTPTMGCPKLKDKEKAMMDKKQLNQMIAKRFVVNDSVINITADDINLLKKSSDFIDGCQEYVAVNEVKDTLSRMYGNLYNAHPGNKLKCLAIKFFANVEDGFDADMSLFIAIHDFLGTPGDNFDVQWGLSRDKEIQENQLLICMVGGFNK